MQGKADRVTQQHGEDLGSVLARLTLDRVGCCCCLQTYLDVLGKWAGGIHDRIHAGALNVYVCEVNIGHLHWVLSALRCSGSSEAADSTTWHAHGHLHPGCPPASSCRLHGDFSRKGYLLANT